ncbi:MAG: tRNA (guanosine(46)-N7)-methyltransferase TrmB [Bacilli bacterium]
MRLKHKPWGDELIKENLDLVITADRLKEDIFQNFIKKDNLYIEIGSGKGDFIIEMAKKYPSYHFIAVEMQSMAIAYIVRKLEAENIDNVLLVNSDIGYIFEELNGIKFQTIFLNFSDPWPKKRQQKRRLTYPTKLQEYAKIIAGEGKLIFKTDNESLFIDSLEYVKDSPFEIESSTFDYKGDDDFDAQTEYEKKFRTIGTPIKRFIAKLKNK